MYKAVVLEDTQGFAALKREWDDLYDNSPLATPFQSWAWLYSWWESYGESYELRLVTVRDDKGLLVGLAPLVLERRPSFGRLLFIGTGITDHLDMLARRGRDTTAAEAGRRALQQTDSWHVADLQEVRPEAVVWDIFRGWAGPRVHIRQSSCPVLDAGPWEELLAPLSRNGREKARKAVRRAKEDGARRESADQRGVEQAARSCLALHRESWRGRGITSEHLTQRFSSHVLAAARRMSASGCGGVYEFRRGKELVASDFVLLGHEYVAGYLQGASEYALRRYQVTSLFTRNWADIALERGVRTVNLLRGVEQHKLRWNPEKVDNHRLILGKNRFSFAPYAAYHLLRSEAAQYAKSEDAPAWVKFATVRLKGFLPK